MFINVLDYFFWHGFVMTELAVFLLSDQFHILACYKWVMESLIF